MGRSSEPDHTPKMGQSLSLWEQLIESLPLEKKPANLTIGNELNRGAWGVVYDGVLGRRPVAVKAIHEGLFKGVENGDNAVRNFCTECDRLEALEDNHVIKFLGAFKDAKLGPILVMEKMKENLREFLERHKDTLTVLEQLRISLEITEGVAFLHQLTPPMVHRDLNDKNVMFTFDGVAKIGDFGQSKLKRDLYLTTDLPGMIPFMPPEALRVGNSKYDESLDMFSLGVLMLEIGTQDQPIPNIMGIGITVEVKRREADLGRMSLLHPLKPFILLCLSDSPKQRPKAFELRMILTNLHESQQEVARLKGTQQELEGAQQAHTRTRQELERVQQAHTGTRRELSRTQQELEKATSAVQKQMKVDCTRHTEQVESELAATRQRLKAKEAELHGTQQQLTQLQAKLKELAAARKPTLESDDQRVHTSTQLPQRQWKVDELYLHVQERSIVQQKTIDTIVHTLEEHIQDSVESAEFTEGSPMYVACERYSEGYKNWALGYEIILCSVLQLCYETCGAVLTNKVACEAVRAYKDGRSFAPEVVTMLQNSLAEEDHTEFEGVASCLVVKGFSIPAQAQQSNSKQYMAVYSLITAYLDITPAQDYIASAKRDILADEVLKVATEHSCVEAFVDKVLPLCWQLVIMFVPPILKCDRKVKVDRAHHDLSRMSSRADTVQSYLFPVVWYGGDVHRKARVLAENFK